MENVRKTYLVKLDELGNLYERYWYADIGEYKWHEVHPNEVTSCLWYTITLEQDLKVKHIFKFLEKHEDQFSTIFSDHYIEEYVQKFREIDEPEESDLDSLHVSKSLTYQKISEREYEHSMMLDLTGRKEDDDTSYGIDFMPLEKLLNIDFVIDNNFKICDLRDDEPQIDNLKGIQYTMFEVLNCFMHEISFHGKPEQKKERGDNLKERVEGAEEKLEEGELELTEIDED